MKVRQETEQPCRMSVSRSVSLTMLNMRRDGANNRLTAGAVEPVKQCWVRNEYLVSDRRVLHPPVE